MTSDPLDWLTAALADLEQRELRRRLVVREARGGAVVLRDGVPLVNFASNDYLALAADARLGQAAAAAALEYGSGAGASPVVSGRTPLHAQLEARLARLLDCEAALVFASGFAAGAGVVPALVGEGDLILSDELNHACLIDGCRLARAEKIVYRHADVVHLSELLSSTRDFRRRLIVTDTIFSMGGDVAPLVAIGQLAEQHGAMLLVDEAHATGVWGPSGAGVVEHLTSESPQLAQQVSIRMGTLSKALGAAGGFVAGSQRLIDWLANRARSYVFSTAPAPPVMAAALAALDIVAQEPTRRTDLLARAAGLRAELQDLGCQIGPTTSQIIPIIVGSPGRAMRLSHALAEAGFWVPGIRPPTVPEGGSLVRISLRADHTPQQLAELVGVVAACGLR